MKCEFVSFDTGLVSKIIIEIGKVYISEGEEEQVLDVDSKICFNTLISLFSLKDSWEKRKCPSCLYQVSFKNGGKIEIFKFDNKLPNNWSLFMSYISRLVGEVL